MTMEEQLKTKTYYKQLIHDTEEKHPVTQLAELLIHELKQDVPDATDIRFSQGEVYYHCKDYEAAIFKWEQVANELAPWAKKNMADAYLELEQYELAEELYRSIETDSLVLQMEVKFQLFNLYYNAERMVEADQVIKEALDLNPDYPNLTKIARLFFEENEDWLSAIELAKREGLRTKSLVWFERLKSYIHRGLTKDIQPAYFVEIIPVLYSLDAAFFEQFVISLWESYEGTEYFNEWLISFNEAFLQLDTADTSKFHELGRYYEKAYHSFLNKNFTLNQLKPIISNLLFVWLRIVEREKAVFPAAAIFAWNDKVADSIAPEALQAAEQILFDENYEFDTAVVIDDIGQALIDWSKNHQLEVDRRLLGIWKKLQKTDTTNIAIAGMFRREFFYQLFSEEEYVPTSLVPVFYQYGNGNITYEYGRNFAREVNRPLDPQTDGIKTDGRFFVKTVRNTVLKNHSLALLDFPEVYSGEHNMLVESMDCILYFLQPNVDQFEDELLELRWLRKEYPELALHVVIDEENYQHAEYRQDVEKVIERGHIFTYEQLTNINELFRSIRQSESRDRQMVSLNKSITLLQRLIHDFLQQRIRAEHNLLESIHKKEDILQRLNGAHYQLSDLQSEMGERIANAFGLIKEDLVKEIAEQLPKILKATAKEIPETSDATNLHVMINKKMNEKINQYLNGEILEELTSRSQDWLVLARDELEQGKAFLEEIESGFNRMLGEERLELTCDFKVLEDWQRDITRFTTKSLIRDENILLRYTPSQILLKGAGKVLGNFAKGKPLVINHYKNFIANEDYTKVVERVSEQFFSLFTLMEQGLTRDVSLFFKDALEAINKLIEELKQEVADERGELENLRENPETFRDPLTIFEIRLLENRYMLEAKQPSPLRQ